ncbi:HlyD family secretion protein [Paracoccus seriniphilus]|uniref:HlyD family secretion protein n=1 Tax=Paracoccus seriniphilus TaxID=184748 RepID=UPI0035677CB1
MARHDRNIVQTDKIDVTADPAEMPLASAPRKSRAKRIALVVLGIAVIGAALDFGYDYWTTGRFMVETDDAYVTADTTVISSRVQGYVVEVPVKQNDRVKAGDILVKLDDGDYRIALETAKEKVRTADQTIARIDAQITAAKASVEQARALKAVAEAQLRAAQRNYERAEKLAQNSVTSQARLDEATETLETTTASLASAEATILNAEAQVGVLQAQKAEAQGTRHELELTVKQAQRDLDLTVLRAPADGTIGNLSIEIGDLVTPGANLAALVPLDSLYVEANFKETQMYDLALGADVHVTFDAIPGQTFKGKVTSMSPATGSVFSLLPADNATGNFTKIVQRVPVHIDIPRSAIETGHLRAGLSAVVEVDSRTGSNEGLAMLAKAE